MSLVHIRTVHPVRQLGRTPALSRRRAVITVEVLLLAGTLTLAGIVKVNPGPLPGDLDMTIAWQHLIRPIQPLTNFLEFISLVTWPTYVFIQMAVLVVLLGLLRRWLDIALALLTAGVADGSNFVISQFDRRPRPAGAGLYVHEHITQFFSFPSGHVEHVIAFLGILVYLSFQVRRPHAWLWVVRVPLLVMIVLMGPARMLAGEHWPSDVLAGGLWGTFWLIVSIQLYHRAANRWPWLLPPNEGTAASSGNGISPGSATRTGPSARADDRSTGALPAATPARGLSESEVRARRLNGHGNTEPPPTTRTYGQIVRHNLLTFINVCLFGLGLALVALGRPMDALSAVGLICFNAVITAVQEIRTKRTLDRSLVVASRRVTVIRGGEENRVAPGDLVAGDLVQVEPGDQVVVDGQITRGWLVVDESLLSGKPQYVPKQKGDHVISGSTCVGGNATYVAEKVGARSLIHRVASGASARRRGPTPLQKQVNFVFGLSLIAAVYIELLLVVRAVVAAANLGDSLEQSAVIANLVPASVVLTVALAYAIGAIRVLRSGALVQEANAVESLSNLSVLCLDKTGTLTTNRFQVDSIEPIGIERGELQRILADLAASSTTTRVSEAIGASMTGCRRKVEWEIPYSPDRRWGGIAFDDPGGNGVPPLRGIYVIGIPEVLEPHLQGGYDGIAMRSAVDAWVERGLMVLQVAGVDVSASVPHHQKNAQLPDGLTPIGFVTLQEELRPEAYAGLTALREAGLELKIISGDDPSAVARVARRAGIETDVQPISGHELAEMHEIELANAAEKASIFGGVTAAQKEKLVEVLQSRGHYVGMVGDGLNDVLALKRAQVGIAMQTGNDVARDAADMVLLNDSLSTLAPIIGEGQRIVNSLQPALKLFMTRISASALVILSSLTVADVFPIRLRHGTILTILTVAIPTVLLALWAKPGPLNKRGPMRQQAHFVIPAALISSMVGLLLFYGILMLRVLPFISNRAHYTQAQLQSVLQKDLPTAQTELACFLVLTGLILVVFVAPPTTWWVGGSELSGDRRPTVMALGLTLVFGMLLQVPLFRSLFGLAPLGVRHLAVVVGASVAWLFLLRAVWRVQLGERLLRVERKPGAWYRHAAAAPDGSSGKGIDIGWTTDTESRPTPIQ